MSPDDERPTEPERVDWSSGQWTNPPVAAVAEDDGGLRVTAAAGSDAWRTTSYGFVHANEHALLAPLGPSEAVEVTFDGGFDQQFDQAGVFVRVDDEVWVKAGVEYADGDLQLGAVVTHRNSDWSSGPVPHWQDRRITVRVSRTGDALTVRARADDGPSQLVRVSWLDPTARAEAGPFLCAPTRSGLTVVFRSWTRGPADASLH